MNFCQSVKHFYPIFNCVDPDQYSEYGFGSTQLLNRIRNHNSSLILFIIYDRKTGILLNFICIIKLRKREIYMIYIYSIPVRLRTKFSSWVVPKYSTVLHGAPWRSSATPQRPLTGIRQKFWPYTLENLLKTLGVFQAPHTIQTPSPLPHHTHRCTVYCKCFLENLVTFQQAELQISLQNT